MSVKVDLSGLIDFERFIDDMVNGFEEFLRKFLLKEALRALASTKRRTPYVTGHLRNSWQISDVRKSGGYLIVEIFNPVEYASYVEYGHAQEPGRYVPAIGKRLKASWVPGKFMSTVAIKRVEAQLPRRYETEFRKWVQGLNGKAWE